MEFAASRVYRGITTGLNEAFLIDDEQRDALVAADKKNKNIIKPFAAGRDIKRWRVVTSKRWIIFTRRGFRIEEYPLIKAHLSEWKHRLRPKHVSDGEDCEGRKPGSYQWFEIQDEINYHAEFLKPKIVSTKVSIEPTFALDANNTFLGNTSYFIPFAKDSHFVLSVLNSQSSKFFAQNVFVGKQNGWYEVQPTALENFPIPTASPTDRAALAALAQKCLDAGGVGCEAFEKEIDERVAGLYGL